jgi:Tol biopolymer transport system component
MTPDRQSVIFVVDGREGSSIVAMNVATRSFTTLIPPSYNATSPGISPDGSQVVFAAVRDGRSSIFTSTISGTDIKPVRSSNENCRTPAWKGSTREVIYSTGWGLVAFSLATNTEVKLSTKGDSSPCWISE